MSTPQVGQGAVAVVPTFKGFRSAVNKETDAAAKSSAKGFRALWSREGDKSGKTVGTGFRKAFEGESKGFTDKSTRELEQAVSRSSRALSQARLKQLDQVGKVRVAERQLAEAQSKHATGSSQVVRAMERLQSETRKLEAANESTARSTKDLRDAQSRLAASAGSTTTQLRSAGTRGAEGFRSGLVGGIGRMGPALVGAIAALGIGALVANTIRDGIRFAFSTIDLAAGLEQSVGAVDAVFKDASAPIHEWAKRAVNDVGLTQNAYNQLATRVGAQLKNLGIPMDQIAGKTNDLITLGADLAAQYGGNTADAVSALSSLLRGERDPIEAYGVTINDARLQAKLAEMGLKDLTGAGADNAKMQATLALLWEQTADAQGRFAAEADTFAGKQQRLNAGWEEIRTTIGTALLPVATQFADVMTRHVLPSIEELVNGPSGAKGLKGAFADATPAFEVFGKEVLPLLPSLFKSIAETLPSVIELMTTLSPVIIDLAKGTNSWFVGFSELMKLLGGDITLQQYASKLESLSGSLGNVARGIQYFGATTRFVFGQVQTSVGTTVSAIQSGFNTAVAFIGSIPGRIREFFNGAGTWLYNSGKAIIQGFIDGINAMFTSAGNAVSGVIDWVMGFFPNSPAKRGPLSGPGWAKIEHSGTAVVDQWTSGMGKPDLSAVISPALSAVAASTALGDAVGASQGFPRRVYLVVKGREFEAYVDERADGRVETHSKHQTTKLSAGKRVGA